MVSHLVEVKGLFEAGWELDGPHSACGFVGDLASSHIWLLDSLGSLLSGRSGRLAAGPLTTPTSLSTHTHSSNACQ